MLLVQDFLRVNSLSALEAAHGVKARIEGHKLSLNYDQIESREDDKLAQQCRGLILRVADLSSLPIEGDSPLGDTVVLARPFDRFFNLGQAAAAQVDFDHPATAFYEKMDGTLCIVYFDDIKGEWHVATRSVPEANLPVDGFGDFTFRTLFEKALGETVGKDFVTWSGEHLHRDVTYMFELTTPLNRIVVDYGGYGVTLLGARKSATGEELDPAFVQAQVKTPTAERYRFGSVSELVDFVSDRDPTKHEGIVVCDHLYRRVKIKNAAYVALGKIRDRAASSPRALLEIVLQGKDDDVASLLPDHLVSYMEEIKNNLRDWCRSMDNGYVTCLAAADGATKREDAKEHRKAFALSVQAHGLWIGPLMDRYQGKSDSTMGWIMASRGADGSWSNGFLDRILEVIQK